MNDLKITQDEILAVLPKVAETVADAIGCELEKVKADSSLIDDLGAESIDFVDIIFRLQRLFNVKIPRGKIVEEARGSLSEAEFQKAGVVSDAGVARLRAFRVPRVAAHGPFGGQPRRACAHQAGVALRHRGAHRRVACRRTACPALGSTSTSG